MLILWLPLIYHLFWETVPELPQAQLFPPSLDSTAFATLVLTAIVSGRGFLLGSGSVYCVCISVG